MTDVTQGQDGPQAAPTEQSTLPDAHEMFPDNLPDGNELFPDKKPSYLDTIRNYSSLHDAFFSNPGQSHARILDAFGYGFKQDWGAGQQEFSEADDYLRKAGVYNDYKKGQRNIIKAANEAVMRPAVAAILAAKSTFSGVFAGAQAAVAQTGEEYGAPNLGREIASIPEAFPTGLHQPAGIPHLPEPIAQARELNVIGAGEGGYFGTAPVTAEAPVAAAEAGKVQEAAKPEALPGQEAGPSPIAPATAGPAEAPAAEAAPDIHAVARQIAPETFSEFDALSQKKDTFRRWIDELREVRDENAAKEAPHADEIADLQSKLTDATPRLAKKYQARLDPLIEERNAYIAEQTKGDSADMAKIRSQLMQADYRQRDLAPDVTKAYRDAEARMPQAEATETANVGNKTGNENQPSAAEPQAAQAATETAPSVAADVETPIGTGAAARNNVSAAEPAKLIEGTAKASEVAGKQAVAPTEPEAERLPIAHAPSIVADVTQKLKAAGRPAEEADAAAQIVAAYWETRAQRFEGAKGTAAEMYAREAPEIVAGKEKPSKAKKARELELAQKSGLDLGKELNQTAYHGSPYDFDVFDTGKIGTGEGAQAYGHGLYFAEHPETATFYRDALTKAVPTVNGRVQSTGSGKFNVVDDFGVQAGPFDTKEEALASMRGQPGNLYRVDVKPQPNEFLQWDKPLRDQPDLLKALEQVTPKPGWVARQIQGLKVIRHEMATNPESTGAQAYGALSRLLGGDKAATDALRDAGVPGIRYLDQGSRAQGEGTHNYVVFDPKDIEILDKNGKPVSRKEFEQNVGGVKGRIRVRDDARNTITLMKNADASTFIHETGHDWLERMLDDARDEEAPQALRNDAQTILKWLKVDSPDGVKTSHHEKFARGFETYMLEGRAPSSALARVFAQFRDWLTTIYRTAAALKAPISDDIRAVFDRLLAEKPEKTVIAPERSRGAGKLAEKHEPLVEATAPERAHEVANTIEAERDSQANRTLVKAADHDTRLSDTGAETEGRAPRGAQSSSDADASRPVGAGSGEPGGSGALGEGGSETAAEGARAREKPAAEQLDPTTDLPRSETQLVDKAGNIRLDNLGTPEDVSAVIRATAEELAPYEQAITRGRVSDAEVLKLADALGMDVAQLSERKLGQAFNAEQIVAARKLLIQSAGNVRDLAAKIAGGTEQDVVAYAEARARHLMIQEQVSGLTAEAGRALRAFRDLGGSKEAADLSAFLKNTQGKTLYQMKEEGALLAMMGTPQQVSKAVHEANLSTYQKVRAGTLSWFINNLISGPITHGGYIIGNVTTQLFKATVDTSVAAAMGAIRNAPAAERVHLGEVGAQLYGMVKGMRDGYSPAITAMKTGVPFMKGDVEGMLGQIEAAHRPQAIPGKFGYVMETPSRAVTAIHTMHYSMNYEAEIARRAYRSALAEGFQNGSTEFNQKIAEFTQSPPEAEMEAAHDEALKGVLMKSSQFGTSAYHLQQAVNKNILAKIVMPFMQVGANILHESFVERTPIGLASQAVRDNLSGKNGAVARDTQRSRIAVGIGISTAVVGLTAEGILTGGGPSDSKQMAVKEMTGWRPYSIKIGESYVPFRKYLGGLGPLIAGTADIYEAGHALSDEGLSKAAAASLFGFAEVIADESWAKGLANFIDAARHWDRDGERYLRNLAADFIPMSIGLSQLTNLSDPYRREVRTMLDVARAHIPGLSRSLYPVRDIWGEPIESHTALGPSQANHDPATKALLDAGYYPARMDRKIRGVELSDQQYDDLTRLAGRMSRMRVNALINTPGYAQWPKEVQAKQLQEVISNPTNGAREIARGMILMQTLHDPDSVLAKANANKLDKLKKMTGATVH